MATLVRDVERPAFLDRPAADQLSFGGGGGGVAAPTAPARPSSERVLGERAASEASGRRGTALADATRGGGATLDELLVGAWEGLSARRPVACPVCAGAMAPRTGAAGGACGDCGSQVR